MRSALFTLRLLVVGLVLRFRNWRAQYHHRALRRLLDPAGYDVFVTRRVHTNAPRKRRRALGKLIAKAATRGLG